MSGRPEPAAVLAPKRYQIMSGSALKLLAVVSMLVDHVAGKILVHYPQFTQTLYRLGETSVTTVLLLRSFGRLAFPIFCFLLVEGFTYTRDRWRYGASLACFAVLSEIPFDLARSMTAFDGSYQNVFLTLLVGYLALCAYEHFEGRLGMQAACVIGLALVSMGLLCDYGPRGYALILILYFLRSNTVAKTALGCCVTTATWRAGLAFIPLNLYNGTRGFVHGPVLKYAFYAFYPLHLLALWQLRLSLGI